MRRPFSESLRWLAKGGSEMTTSNARTNPLAPRRRPILLDNPRGVARIDVRHILNGMFWPYARMQPGRVWRRPMFPHHLLSSFRLLVAGLCRDPQESPHKSYWPKNIGEERLLQQHEREALHQRCDPIF